MKIRRRRAKPKGTHTCTTNWKEEGNEEEKKRRNNRPKEEPDGAADWKQRWRAPTWRRSVSSCRPLTTLQRKASGFCVCFPWFTWHQQLKDSSFLPTRADFCVTAQNIFDISFH